MPVYFLCIYICICICFIDFILICLIVVSNPESLKVRQHTSLITCGGCYFEKEQLGLPYMYMTSLFLSFDPFS